MVYISIAEMLSRRGLVLYLVTSYSPFPDPFFLSSSLTLSIQTKNFITSVSYIQWNPPCPLFFVSPLMILATIHVLCSSKAERGAEVINFTEFIFEVHGPDVHLNRSFIRQIEVFHGSVPRAVVFENKNIRV